MKLAKILTAQQGMASAVMILMTAMLLSVATGLVYVGTKNFVTNRTSGDAAAAEQAAIGGIKHLMSYLDYRGWTGSNAQTWLDSHPTWQGTLTADADNPNWSSTYNVTWRVTKDDDKHWEYTLASTGTHNNVNRVVYAVIYVEKDTVNDIGNDITALTSTNPTVFRAAGNETWQANKSGGFVDFDCVSGYGWLYMRFGDGDKFDLDDLAQKIAAGKADTPMDIAYQVQVETAYHSGGGGNGFGIYYLMQDGNFNEDGAASGGISGYVVQYDPGLTTGYNWRVGQVKIGDNQSTDVSKGCLLTRKTNKNITSGSGNEDRSDNAYAFEDNQGYDYSRDTNVPWYDEVDKISKDNNVFCSDNNNNNTDYISKYATTDVVQVPFEHVKALVEHAYQKSHGTIGVADFEVADNHRMEIKVKPIITDASAIPPKHDDVTAVYIDGVLVLRYIDRCNTYTTHGDPDSLPYNIRYTHGASGIKIWQAKFKVTNLATTHAGRKPYIIKWKNN